MEIVNDINQLLPPPTELSDITVYLENAKEILQDVAVEKDQAQLLASYCMRYAVQIADEKYQGYDEGTKQYVEELRRHSSIVTPERTPHHSHDHAEKIQHLAQIIEGKSELQKQVTAKEEEEEEEKEKEKEKAEKAEMKEQSKNEELKSEGNEKKVMKGPQRGKSNAHISDEEFPHFQMICNYAIKAMKHGEKFEQENKEPTEVARMFHTAVLFFQVLRIFGPLSPGDSDRLSYCKWKTKQASHLLENCVIEHDREDVNQDYIINESQVLGRGSYGIVCTAQHKATKNLYACKILKINRTTPRFIAKLHEEIAIMRELDHPNIVRLHKVFYEQRRILLIMDVCTGGELYQYVAKQPDEHISESAAITLTIQMLSAIKFMHQNNVVHRDLKLENWLLESDEERAHLKLVDFGLSKHFTSREVMNHQVGSIFYVAPEVLAGEYSEKCDLWSTGVIVYMILSGIPPFWGRNDADIQQQIYTKELTFPESHFEDVSEEAKDFISKLLTRDYEVRMNADEALKHPWLLDAASSRKPLSTRKKNEIVTSLRQFSQTNNFVRVISEILAFNFSSEQIRRMRDLFNQIDTDHSGTLSVEELKKAIFEGQDLGNEEVLQLFNAINITHTDEIRYHEFLAATMWNKIHLDQENLYQIFAAMDQDNSGFLTKESIKNAVGVDFNDAEIDKMIADADLNGDGKIDYEEFARLWKENAIEKELSGPKKSGVVSGIRNFLKRISYGS